MIGLIIQQSSLYKSSFKQQCQRTDQKTAEREFNLNGYLTLIRLFFVRFMTMDNYRNSQNLGFSLLDLSFFVGVLSKTS